MTAPEPMTSPPAATRGIRWRRVIGIALLVLVAVVALGAIWFVQPQQVLPEADAALISSDTVLVDQTNGRITFAPADGATTGFILYPGGKVPAKGYATTARMIAEEGYLVVIPEMPLNFAVLDTNAADGVIAAHPEITSWAIGGHSLGGAMAGSYVASHPDAIDGLVLWAAYSASDVADSGVATAVVYGTLDSGAGRITSPDSLLLLPHDTVVTPIVGGNHANFGSYTGQPNDPEATIPREEQQRQAAAATVALLESISGAN
jgi:Alpha/beta hydrolase family